MKYGAVPKHQPRLPHHLLAACCYEARLLKRAFNNNSIHAFLEQPLDGVVIKDQLHQVAGATQARTHQRAAQAQRAAAPSRAQG